MRILMAPCMQMWRGCRVVHDSPVVLLFSSELQENYIRMRSPQEGFIGPDSSTSWKVSGAVGAANIYTMKIQVWCRKRCRLTESSRHWIALRLSRLAQCPSCLSSVVDGGAEQRDHTSYGGTRSVSKSATTATTASSMLRPCSDLLSFAQLCYAGHLRCGAGDRAWHPSYMFWHSM